MSIKSSTVRCLGNAIVHVPCNYWDRALNITIINNFQNNTFETITIMILTIVILIQLFFLMVGSKQKIIKMKAQNTMAPSYHSKSALLKTKELRFSLVWVITFSIVSSCFSKLKVSSVTLTWQSSSTFHVCVKTAQ